MLRHSRLLIEALAATREVELIVVHPHRNETLFPDLSHVTEHAIAGFQGLQHYYLELRAYSDAVRRFVNRHPDHLVYGQGLSAWMGIEVFGDRTILNPHGLEPYQATGFVNRLKTWPYRLAFNNVFKRAHKVVSLGGRLTDIIRPRLKRPEQLVVLPNATNLLPEADAVLHKEKGEPMVFMFVGRFSSNKGIGDLLEAARLLNERGWTDRFSVDLSGKGPLFEEMQQRYALPNVRFR